MEFDDSMPYDFYGNIRVCQVYWKSFRPIQKVKSYDPETGEGITGGKCIEENATG